MKITLITSNQNRHKFLTNLLSNISSELYVIQEKKNFLQSHSSKKVRLISDIRKEYFSKVEEAKKKIFGSEVKLNEKIKETMTIELGELNKTDLNKINTFFKSDIYIVFGSSFLKGELVKFLIKKKAINIHMGVSPYYRGTDCNFWALYDGNPHLVGATIHYISEGLDSGPILYHAICAYDNSDPFLFTMSSVKSAFCSLVERLKNQSIFAYGPILQDKSHEIRYSKRIDFNDQVIKNFLNKKIDLQSKKFDLNLLKDPFVLNSI